MIKNSKIEPNEKNVDVVINPGVIKTQTPGQRVKLARVSPICQMVISQLAMKTILFSETSD